MSTGYSPALVRSRAMAAAHQDDVACLSTCIPRAVWACAWTPTGLENRLPCNPSQTPRIVLGLVPWMMAQRREACMSVISVCTARGLPNRQVYAYFSDSTETVHVAAKEVFARVVAVCGLVKGRARHARFPCSPLYHVRVWSSAFAAQLSRAAAAVACVRARARRPRRPVGYAARKLSKVHTDA